MKYEEKYFWLVAVLCQIGVFLFLTLACFVSAENGKVLFIILSIASAFGAMGCAWRTGKSPQ